MIKIAVQCSVCGAGVETVITYAKGNPYWATKLWKKALSQGWVRDRPNQAVFCSECKAQAVDPSAQTRPVETLLFNGIVECDHCGTQLEQGTVHFPGNFSHSLRTAAREHGSKYIYLNRQYKDLCLRCALEITDDKPTQLIIAVWTQPTRLAAKHMGISDKALEKQCERWGISKPGRGFWAKWQHQHYAECRTLLPDEIKAVLGDKVLNEVYPLERSTKLARSWHKVEA